VRSLLPPGTSSKTSPHRCKKLSPKSHPSQVLTLHLQYSPQAMQKPCQTFQFSIILNQISDITHQNIFFQYHKDHIPGILRPSTSLSPPLSLQINRTVLWIKDDTIVLLLFMPQPASVLLWIQERYHLIADEYFKPPAKKCIWEGVTGCESSINLLLGKTNVYQKPEVNLISYRCFFSDCHQWKIPSKQIRVVSCFQDRDRSSGWLIQ